MPEIEYPGRANLPEKEENKGKIGGRNVRN